MHTKGHKAAAILFAAMLMSGSSTSLAADHSSFAGHYTTASLSAQEQTAGNLLNSDRRRYGLAPLTLDTALCRIARIKSMDMRDNQYFSHTSPTYGDVRSMLQALGYEYQAASENIAHHATVEKAQAAFLSSPGHRKNVLSSAYTRVGLGIATDPQGYVYLTQIFVR